MRRADIVIIGGGVVGASVAYHLTQRGARSVLILEREREQGMGSTGKATGGVRAQFETEINILMSLYSIDFFSNCDFDCEYEPRGYLFFATTEEQFTYLRRSIEKQRSFGAHDVEVIGKEGISRLIPGLNCEDIVGGSFGARDGFINPLAVMRGFTRGAVGRGAQIEYDTQATRINVAGGRVRSVTTSGGNVECNTVVLCTGAVARDLAGTAGIDLPVEPQRRQIVWGRTEDPLPPGLPMVIDIGTGFHFRPARDFASPAATGRDRNRNRDVLFAFPDPDERSSRSTDFDDAFVAKVYERARHRAPFLASSTVIRDRCRAGLYENTPDHHAIIGGCDIEGLYFASGFSGHGVMHSPATGRALSEIILDGSSTFLDVSVLSLDRFVNGTVLQETAFI